MDVQKLARCALEALCFLYFELDDGEGVTRYFEQLSRRQDALSVEVRAAVPGVSQRGASRGTCSA